MTCNFESNKCECQQGFIHQNDSCLPGVYELFIPLIVKHVCMVKTFYAEAVVCKSKLLQGINRVK